MTLLRRTVCNTFFKSLSHFWGRTVFKITAFIHCLFSFVTVEPTVTIFENSWYEEYDYGHGTVLHTLLHFFITNAPVYTENINRVT